MQLHLNLSDDLQATEPIKRPRIRVRMPYKRVSRSDWQRRHCLLLAQSLAISFYGLTIGNKEAV